MLFWFYVRKFERMKRVTDTITDRAKSKLLWLEKYEQAPVIFNWGAFIVTSVAPFLQPMKNSLYGELFRKAHSHLTGELPGSLSGRIFFI